jgi:O-antigen/teichoic acid export membrane protein
MPQDSTSKRIAKNTLMLYFRQILIMLVSLYTVRVVLEVLGVEDFGIYNVVGGIVSFFSFLSGTMASATQRFFSFALGQGDRDKLKKMFTVNLLIYGGLALGALILLETVGLWFVYNHLNIPAIRFEAVLWIYHFSVFTFIMSLVASPLMALIIAHEEMQLYAYISILEVILKLTIVFLLIVLPWDKLEVYGALLFFVAIIVDLIYLVVCVKRFEECQFRKFYWDKQLFREITGFTGWTLFGQVTTVTRNQAVTILLNQVFSPVVVASRAIATNVSNQINVFSNNFNVGLYPPIIKSYASGDKQGMFSLIYRGSRITFFLMWVFALPLFLEMGPILQLWLKNPPPDAVLFTRLALIEVLINSISLPLITAARAPGRMKLYELILGSIQILIFICSWIVLFVGFSASSVYIVAIIANAIMFIVRLFLMKKLIGLIIRDFVKEVLLPVCLVGLVSSVLSLAFRYVIPLDSGFYLVSIFFAVILSVMSMYAFGLKSDERRSICNIVKGKILKR